MSKTLLYGPDGFSSVAMEETEDELRAMLVVAFAALKGLYRGPGGPKFLEGEELDRYRNHVATRIVDLVGYEGVEKVLGVKLSRTEVRG
jgi:hypothetical protein